jgi:hypothetical protein
MTPIFADYYQNNNDTYIVELSAFLYSNKNGLQITEDSSFNCSVLFIGKGINPLVAFIRKSILFEYIFFILFFQKADG